MKPNITLVVMTLLSILLTSFHFADDIARGIEPGKFGTIAAQVILVVWLCGPLMLAGRRAGLVLMFIGSLFGCLMPIVHMQGAGIAGGRIAGSAGIFFWSWTLVALGATALFAAVLSARELWTWSAKQRGLHAART
ncbi:MAG: hypothetical protein AB7P34_10170 [Vicinamibacterales bacterium]